MITTEIDLAAAVLAQESVVAIPTETVYGLAGNAYSERAVKQIFSLKNRPLYNPLIVHVPSADALNEVAVEIPEFARVLARSFWPGPLTLLLKKRSNIPDLVTAGKPTVAVRVPDHPLTLALLEQIDFPLAAPSANPFGSISPTTAQHVDDYFGERLEVILDGGPCLRGIESTIIGFDGDRPVLYRHGSLSLEAIEEIVGPVMDLRLLSDRPEAPGMLARHYAPRTKTLLVEDIQQAITGQAGKKIGLLLFDRKWNGDKVEKQIVLSESGSLEEAARNLYASMHALDEAGLDLIITQRLPDVGIGKAINDRLGRAIHEPDDLADSDMISL